MDLPHSGSHKDMELIRIETKHLTLMIKGKPYHERYESLKEYRKMDFHDEMQFSVKGKDILDVHVFDVEREQLGLPQLLRPIFFENGVYQLIVVPKTDETLIFHHEHPQLREAVSLATFGKQKFLTGNLQFQNEVGLTYLEIRSDQELLLGITLEIFPVKLDYKKDYQQLLAEVNDEIYNLAYHFIRKTYLHARLKLKGEPSLTEFYRLIREHFQQFIQSIQRIKLQPHHQLHSSYERVRGDQLRKQNSFTRSYLRKKAHVFREVERGMLIGNREMLPTEGLTIRKTLIYDTLENRYVKWMMQRINHKIDHLIERVHEHQNRWSNEVDPVLIEQLHHMKQQLENEANQPFWQNIGKLDRSVMSLVMQMAPGYRDAFQIYLTVSKGLLLFQDSAYHMSVKDIAVLYEYWTFLKLGNILEKKYPMVSQDIVRVNKDGLFVNLQTNKRAQRVFRHPVTKEEIILTYQHYENSLPTTNQIPDTVLKIEKKGKDFTFNYIFDAKYRIDYAQTGSSYQRRYNTPGPMEEDINTMHRYRDAIVAAGDGPYERTAFGAYVLFPWFDEHSYKQHHFYKSINEVNIGGLPFLPNATTLVEKFVERLINKSPEEIYEEGILPIGTEEEWRSDLDEKVLVGLVSTPNEYRSYIQGSYFSFPVQRLKNNWQQASYIALYLRKGVGSVNGVQVYGKIVEIKYTHDSIQFEVDYWNNLETVITPVGYGIANYMMTTLNTLKEAQELPELYMKSTDEMILWRMLRRVSDQIKLDLDVTNIDQATKVREYTIKDISIQMDAKENNLYLIKQNQIESFTVDMLDKNPSVIFKALVKMLSN